VKTLQTSGFARPRASPAGKVRSDAANAVVSRPGRLHISQIPKALAASSPHASLPSASRIARRVLATLFKPVLILAVEPSSTFVPLGFAD